ncbi:hypothetical protein G5714_015755 [Onychostoma macrolepis]|uniref:Uncharacterized protein n=1 Tax=Onychostoma macrolepis TaxID=369639 RepID=A0A7J6CAL4_9TELE|nr:hypothetical protein G5714_015755 [Onychostoma macrolepis]
MNCGREEGATDKFSRKKRKQVKRAEKRSRSNLKSGSINSLGEKLQRSAGPGIRIHLLRSKRPLPDDSHWKAFSGFFNILQAKDPCKGAKARHSATVLEEREHQADGQNMNPNPAAHILGLRASLALLRWAGLWTDPQPADKTLSPITIDCSSHASAAEQWIWPSLARLEPPAPLTAPPFVHHSDCCKSPRHAGQSTNKRTKRERKTDIKALPPASSNPIRRL